MDYTNIIRRLRTTTHRVKQFVYEYRWTILGLLVVFVGVVSMVLQIPAWILIAEAGISILLIGYEIAKNVNEARKTQFFKRESEPCEELIENLPDEQYRALTVNADTFIVYSSLNNFLKLNEVPVVAANRLYTLPPELQRYGKRFLRHVLGNPALFGRRFNGPCLGWNSDMEHPGLEAIEVVCGNYFDVTQSDELAMYDVNVDGEPVTKLGSNLFIKKYQPFAKKPEMLRGFDSSWLFNVIGASTIAITTDGQLVLTEQTAANAGSRDLFAPSGSGAAEPTDLGSGSLTLSDLARNASTRELREEINLTHADITSSETYFLGFGRWIERAARGELLCITFLSIDSDTVNRRPVHSSERVYTRKSSCVRFAQPISQWDPADPKEMLPAAHRTRMSVPLGAALSLLAQEVQDKDSRVRLELVQRGVL